MDTDRRELHRATDVVVVTPQVFDLLDYLIQNRERVVSKDDLISAVWNGRIVSDAALTTRLNAARSAIGDTGENQQPNQDIAAQRLPLRWYSAGSARPVTSPSANRRRIHRLVFPLSCCRSQI